MDNEQKRYEDHIAGRNAVTEALKSGRPLDSVLVARGDRQGSISAIVAKCRQLNIPVKEVDSRKLDFMAQNHQGVIAVAACKEYADLEDLFKLAEERGEKPFFIVCDELEDPHNLGAILRTAEAAGGTSGQHHRNAQRTEKARRLDLWLGYGRRSLVPHRSDRCHGVGGRLRGPRCQPSGEGAVRFRAVSAYGGPD